MAPNKSGVQCKCTKYENVAHCIRVYLFLNVFFPFNRYQEWFEGRKRVGRYKDATLQNTNAEFVAFAKEAFGEGGERYAFRFFELRGDAKTIVGSPFVAKESRFILDGHEGGRRKFVETFCKTQQLARRIAEEFNEKLDSMPRVDTSTPRVTFLDCSVYHLSDINMGEQSVLVEPRIDESKWEKWNDNGGVSYSHAYIVSRCTSLNIIANITHSTLYCVGRTRHCKAQCNKRRGHA